MGGITDAVSGALGGGSARAAKGAASTQAAYQTKALDYLKQKEKLPSAFREAALTGIGGEYGLTLDQEGNIIDDGMSLIERAEASPFYQTSVARGEEGALRYASMHGGLRSGGIKETLARVNQDVLQQTYNQQLQGLQGLASLPSNANVIAGQMSGIGQTLAQGEIAEAQANVDQFGNLVGLGATALMMPPGTFSDPALKGNIVKIGESNGHNLYSWDWNTLANDLNLYGSSVGVMADEVEQTNPEAISMVAGYKVVDYDRIGVNV